MSNDDITNQPKPIDKKSEFRARKAIQKVQHRTLRELSKSGQRARINFVLPRKMKAEWLDLAIKLNLSLSQLIRHAVENYNKDLVDSGSLSANGRVLKKFNETDKSDILDKTVIKKRIKGMIKIQKNLPISKLALAIETTQEKAEKLIYELAASENIEGVMKNDVFEFSNEPEIVISLLSKLIEQM